MAGHESGQEKLTTEEAKGLLITEAPAPVEVLLADPAALIRAHPREALALAAGLGLILGLSPNIRRSVANTTVSVARFLLR